MYSLALLAAASLLFLGAGCSKEARKARFLSRANRAFEAGRYEKAEIDYLNALRLPPADATAMARLAQIYYEQGRLVRAYGFLLQALELNPENVETRARLTFVYSFLRDGKQAEEEADKVLSKQPANDEALRVLSNAGLTTNEIGRIAKKIQQLQQSNPDCASYHLALGTIALRLGDAAGAEAEFNKALSMDPKSPAPHSAIANLLLARNEVDKAGEEFKVAAELSPVRSSRRLKLAEFKLQTGGGAEAKKLLESLTAQAPDYLPAWSYLAQIAMAEQQYEKADALIKKVLAKEPADYEAMMLNGNLKLARGLPAEAIEVFGRMTTLFERAPQVHYRLGAAYAQAGEIPKAESELSKALILDPNHADSILLLSEIRISKGASSQAIGQLEQLVKQQPAKVDAHLLLATAYTLEKNYSGALEVYQVMEKIFPRSPQSPWLAGLMLARLNQPEEARQAWERSLTLAPDFIPPLEQLINQELEQKHYSAAAERVQKELQRRPKVAALQLLFAKVYLAQSDFNAAEAVIQKAIELAPDERTGYVLLSELYLKTNKHQQALEKLQAYVARKTDPAALMQIAVLQDKLKNYTGARDAYEKLLATHPKFGPALNNAAFLYCERLNNLTKAAQYIERARQVSPKDPAVLDTAGWVLFKQGEFARALPLFRESAQKLPQDPEPQFHLGLTLYRLGQERAARQAFERTLQLRKEFYGTDEAARRLGVLELDPASADATAVARLENALQEEPGDLIVLSRLAAIYQRQGSVPKAVQLYETALKQAPQNAHLLDALARLYAADPKNSARALELAKDAHKAAPDDGYICQNLARMVYASGDFKWALSLFEEAARELPGDAELHYDLAWSYYSLGRVSHAEAAMKKALESGDTFEHAREAEQFLQLTAACSDPSKTAGALDRAQQLLAARPDYVPALMISAASQAAAGKREAARELYEKILGRMPLFSPAARELVALYPDVFTDESRAYELAVRAREAFPEDPRIARTLGFVAYKREEFQRSVQLLKESERKIKSDPQIFFYLGMAQNRTREVAEAKRNLKQALALNLKASLAEEARRTLSTLN